MLSTQWGKACRERGPEPTEPGHALLVVAESPEGPQCGHKTASYVFFGLCTILSRGTHPVTQARPPDG